MQWGHIVAVLCAVVAISGFSAERPTLSAPTVADGQLQFTLTCESNSPYRIDASTNLQTWFPVATNFESGATRQIRVPMVGPQGVYRALARSPLFNFALLARETIDLNGNDIVIDSFDSEDPNFSTAGEYDPAKRSDNGDVASSYALLSSGVVIDAGNASIYGTVLTKTNGWVSLGANGKIGDLSWHADTATSGFQAGSQSDDLDFQLTEVTAPFQAGVPPIAGMHNAAFYTYKLTSGDYWMNSLILRTNQAMIVTGNASLYVALQLTFSSSSALVIAPGASLRLYTAATNVVFGGSGVFNSNAPSAFIVYGLPSAASIGIYTDNFNGCIYSPNASVTLNGGGTNGLSLSGSIVARLININGHVGFHYDEALQRTGPFTW